MENWSKSIEADMTTVSSALEYIYKGKLLWWFMCMMSTFVARGPKVLSW